MALVDYIFPRRCLGCGEFGNYFCSECLKLIKPPRRPICPQCFNPSLLGSTHSACLKPLSLDGLVAVSNYEGAVKQAIKKLKYQFVTDLAGDLASLMIRFLRKYQGKLWPEFDSSWVLLPIPLYPQRQKWRGFNQAGLLGRLIAGKMGWSYKDGILIRTRPAKPQAEINNSKQRRANVRWVFKVRREVQAVIREKKVILFDDVWTTGSTIKECAQVLKRRKVGKVWGLALAR
ncbi:MAG: ComF family protein [Candidatus Pacebacteria bacterium]|nr:ComF family protein [Candidatus Paceibacterota bacterium]